MKKIGLVLLFIIIGLGAWYGISRYQYVYSANINTGDEPEEIFIRTEGSFDSLYAELVERQLLRNPESFLWVANRMRINQSPMKGGRYVVKPGTSNYSFVRMLRSGQQEPLNVTIFRKDGIEELAGYIGRKLEPDSLTILRYIRDTFLVESEHYSKENILTLFIPNTYEFYWNTSPEKFVTRMQKENEKFWTEEMLAALEEKKMTKEEAYILASIVERETIAEEEKPLIAGVYLNRLEQNMLLQADPTVIFALGDKSIQRVLYSHLTYDSPYNTYLYGGIPPGPICMPSSGSIEAVVFPNDHDYLFFCAKPEEPGKHAFAETLAGHQQNARRYQQWIQARGIR